MHPVPAADFADRNETPSPRMRCSDADRERIVHVLHHAVGEGRLTLDEGETRIGQAYAATYFDALAALTSDLPAGLGQQPSAGGWVGVWGVLRTQLAEEVAIVLGRTTARRSRRLGAAAILLGPLVLLIVAVALLVVHNVIDGREVEHAHWDGPDSQFGMPPS